MAMLPEGRYRGFFENPVIGISAKKSTPCVKGMSRIADASAGDNNNMRLETELWLTESAAERSLQSLIYAGCTFPPKPGSDEPDLENFEGCGSIEVEFQISHEEYTPEPSDSNPKPRTTTRPRVDFINKVGASRAAIEADDSQKKLISKQFGPLIGKVRAGLLGGGKSDASFDTKAIEAGAAKKKMY